MHEIELIRGLLDEIESEKKYAKDRDNAVEKARKEAKKRDGIHGGYWMYMPDGFDRMPSDAKIKRCAMLIREVCLKLYK